MSRRMATVGLCATLVLAASCGKSGSSEPSSPRTSHSSGSAAASIGQRAVTDLYEFTLPHGWRDVTEQARTVDQTASTVLTRGEPYLGAGDPYPNIVVVYEPAPWPEVTDAPRGPGDVLEGWDDSEPVDGEPALKINSPITREVSLAGVTAVHRGEWFQVLMRHEAGDTKSVAEFDRLVQSWTWK